MNTKKGLRNLVLHAMQAEDSEEAKSKLDRHSIDYFIQQVSSKKIKKSHHSAIKLNQTHSLISDIAI